MAKYEGGCACGAVRYATDADPVIAGHCQCRKCQQLSGTGHASFAAFPEPAVKVTGKVVNWSYTADSGFTATRGHCPVCGSPVVGKPGSVKDVIAVTLASLDDPSTVTPQMGFFSAKAQPWDHMEPGLTRFPGMPPM